MSERVRQQIAASIDVKRQMLENPASIVILTALAETCPAVFRGGNRVLPEGNSGNAADSRYIAAAFVSHFEFHRPGLRSIALTTDTSVLTAHGNDCDFDRLFLRQLEVNGWRGDVFIGTEMPGNSKNILLAIANCSRLGIISVGLSGSGGAAQSTCDYMFKCHRRILSGFRNRIS